MHLTIKERVELVLMSGADGATNRSVAKKFNRIYLAKKFCFNKNVCYYYLNCFICFGALFMAQNVCYYYLNCFIRFGALFMAHPVFLNGHTCLRLGCKKPFVNCTKNSVVLLRPASELPMLLRQGSSAKSSATRYEQRNCF